MPSLKTTIRTFKRRLKIAGFTLLTVIYGAGLLPEIYWQYYALFLTFLFVAVLSIFSYKKNTKNKWGYVVSVSENDLEHRVIARDVLGRRIFPNEVVHHINGKRDDNRLINLCVMDRKKHEHWHAWLDWKKKKDGRYPNFPEQKKTLVNEYGGILLENFRQPHGNEERRIQTYAKPLETNDTKPLFEALRAVRKRIAEEKNIKVYHVCDNHALQEMALKKPLTAEELIQIKGIGYAKLSMYGESFLSVIRNFHSNNTGRDSA